MQNSFAHAGAVVADALQAFLPPERVSVAQWAAENRWLSNEGGGHVGRWDNDRAPYLVEPMEALTNPKFTALAVAGPGQCGKTEILNNWMLQTIDTDPASMLRFMQTDDALRAYVKDKINPMIESHDAIRAKQGLRPVDDSLGFKRFRGMTVQFLAAARSNLISKDAPRIGVDEVDACDPSLGDLKNLVDIRRQTYGRESMAAFISHPDRAGGSDAAHWNAGVMAVYADSTRCTWWWPCPHCGAFSSPNPGTVRHMALAYPTEAPLDQVAAEAHLVCPVNDCLIEDGERDAMNRRGRWVGQGQTIDEEGNVIGERVERETAGYWIVGVMSPFLLHGIGGLASARVKAQRAIEAGEDDKSLREVMTKQWGVPYDPPRRFGSLDAAVLAERAEPGLRLGIVPPGVRFLTAAADVQGGRFEGMVRGWGEFGENWIVDHWNRPADPATSPADWDAMIQHLMRPLPLADGSGRLMRVHVGGYDSGGEDGVTTLAYEAWLRARRAGIAKLRGKVDGRDAWTLLPLKGMGTPNAQRLAVVYPDSQRADRRAGARGQIPTGQFSSNRFKDDLSNQLAVADAAAGYVHIPADLKGDHLAQPRSPLPPHRFFEQLVTETRNAQGQWSNARRARNEATDLMVMTHVLAHLHGLLRLRWEAPRPWFAPWDSNSGVITAEAAKIVPARVLPSPAAPLLAPAETPADSAPRRKSRWNF